MGTKNKPHGFLPTFDSETGEIPAYIAFPLTKKYLKGDFFLAMQEGFIQISKMRLTGEQLKVLLFLMGKLDFENWIPVNQKEIAEELSLKRPNVSRALKRLEENGIIVKGEKNGRSWTYRLETSYGYKGKGKNLAKVEKAVRKAKEHGFNVIEGGKKEKEEE
ncbi:helix-turn-helix domain-containing protein [Salinithrix halophila]|uniref:Helix-turn-helix domain-containing protein n=1 Tax=Salinithrix halophila TaxID=1485204 RepID=A0ABV8J8N9_9BACL